MDDERLTSIPDMPDRRGAIGVAIRDGRLLLIRRSNSVVAPGMYCFPGGGIESGETEQDALIREFREELNALVCPICPIWQCVTPWKARLHWWTVEVPQDEEMFPNPREVASIHWVTPAEMAVLPDSLPSNVEFLAAWKRGDFVLEGIKSPG